MDSGERILRGMPRRGAGGPPPGVPPAWSPSPSTKRMIVTALVLGAVFAFLWLTARFWIQWWWFESIGYQTALTTRYISGAIAFVVAALLVGGFFAANWSLALRRRESASRSGRLASSRVLRWPLWLLTVALALFAGWFAAEQWVTWRLALAGTSFGITDPLFGMDAGFYVFRLPALELAHRAALTTVLLTLVAVALIYVSLRGLDRLDQLQASPRTRRHLLGLAALLLVLFGAGYLLANYELQYSQRGFTPGPGFTDVTIVRLLNYLLAMVSVIAAIVLVGSRRMEQLRWLGIVAVAWVVAVVLGQIVPQLVQQTIVEPNELQREAPYIANNIAMTRIGFALEGVESRSISGQGEPPASALQ